MNDGYPVHDEPLVLAACALRGFVVCNALGADSQRALEKLLDPAAGLRPSRAWSEHPSCIGALPADLPPLPAPLEHYDSRSARLLSLGLRQLAAPLEQARARWGSERIALLIGSTTAGIDASERAYPSFRQTGSLPEGYCFKDQHAFEALLAVAIQQTGVGGPAYVVSTACSSSAKILGSAQRLLTTRQVDAVLAVGVDALCQLTLRGFRALSVLADERAQPFSPHSPGMNLGEGVAALLLERATNSEAAECICLLGVGESCDAYHPTAPEPSGQGAEQAMRRALQQAAIEPAHIDYINAHGTGTRLNDAAERSALQRVFGPRVSDAAPSSAGRVSPSPAAAHASPSSAAVLVSSTKHLTGHLLGAAGATEAAFCAEALRQGRLPANAAFVLPSARPAHAASISQPGLELVDAHTRTHRAQYALSNSLAFGGSNVSILLGPAPQPRRGPTPRPPHASSETRASAAGGTQPRVPSRDAKTGRACRLAQLGRIALWAPGIPNLAAWLREGHALASAEPAADLTAPALLSARAWGRASPLTRTFARLLQQLAGDDAQALQTTPVVYVSAYGEMSTTIGLLDSMVAGSGELSPAAFAASTHNTAAGLLSIATKNTGFHSVIAAGTHSVAMGLLEAMTWLTVHGGSIYVVAAEEAAHPFQGPDCQHRAFGLGWELRAPPSPTEGTSPCGTLSLPRAASGSARARGAGWDSTTGSDEARVEPGPFARKNDFLAHLHAGGIRLLEGIAAGQSGRYWLSSSDSGAWYVDHLAPTTRE